MKRVKSNLASTAALAWLLTQTGLMMKFTFLRYTLVLSTFGTFMILGGSNRLVAQNSPVVSQVEPAQAPPIEPPAPALEETAVTDEGLGYQALVQGPVHEAFAAPVPTDHSQGIRLFDQPPPAPIDEQPPETQADVVGMKWIAGYWTWSDEVSDYVWVSGLWRKVPQGRIWNPGYWSETQSGLHRWTSGYWGGEGTSTDTAKYLPVPPRSIDNGPSTAPPGEDYFWVPGNWEYVDANYRWRSGYWSLSQGDWVWQPACYVYTPHGYVMVDGYWDYLPPDRGQLYAPVTFYEPIYLQPNYVYRPRYPLANAASLLLSLFIRPGYPHYYYGDYYGSLGYRPWYDAGFGSGYITPWFNNYDRMYRRSGIDFVGSLRRYQDHSHVDWKQKQVKHPGGKKSNSGDAPWIADGTKMKGESGRSMDAFIRSDAGRVPIHPSGKLKKGESGQHAAFPSSGLSRSTGHSDSPGSLKKMKPNDHSPSSLEPFDSRPSQGSNKSSKSGGQGDSFSPSIQRGGGTALGGGGKSGESGSGGKVKSESKSKSGGSKAGGKGKK
jgi:WXXGXW repeat (2 copies)